MDLDNQAVFDHHRTMQHMAWGDNAGIGEDQDLAAGRFMGFTRRIRLSQHERHLHPLSIEASLGAFHDALVSAAADRPIR
ncbi:MAG: hypothetical protein U5N27_11750 [Rhizobium sp.]|nr:hypothetical protein [Rhizobium sp.]